MEYMLKQLGQLYQNLQKEKEKMIHLKIEEDVTDIWEVYPNVKISQVCSPNAPIASISTKETESQVVGFKRGPSTISTSGTFIGGSPGPLAVGFLSCSTLPSFLPPLN